MALTDTWDETTPAGTDNISEGDDKIREFKVGMREAWQVDHTFPSTGSAGDATLGYHKAIHLKNEASDPTAVADMCIVYTKDVSSKSEVHVRDEDGDIVQITGGGAIKTALTTQGDILYHDGTSDARLGAGTAELVLTTKGAGANPTWELCPTLDLATGAGEILYASAANVFAVLAAGSAGEFLRSGGAGAPTWAAPAEGELAAASVDQATLKTTTGESSVGASSFMTPAGGTYGFFPQLKATGSTGTCVVTFSGRGDDAPVAPGTSYATRVYNTDRGTATAVAVQTRYVTTSGVDHWLFVLVDKGTGDIISAYQAPDHPSFGRTGSHITFPHPFEEYFTSPVPSDKEIAVIDMDSIKDVKKGVAGDRTMLDVVHSEYTVDMSTEVPYVPLHTGTFAGKELVRVKELPPGVRSRRLKKLTPDECRDRNMRCEQKGNMWKSYVERMKASKRSAMVKLKALGLTDDEVNALRGSEV